MQSLTPSPRSPIASKLHNLLLLSDSALPLGSFAFSAGLESYLAHQPRRSQPELISSFHHFLHLSLSSLAKLTLPYVYAAFTDPSQLARLDNDLDASTTCSVAKRASIAQGRALISIWDRSLKVANDANVDSAQHRAAGEFTRFSALLRDSLVRSDPGMDAENAPAWFLPSGHLAPLFGVIACAMDLDLEQTLYLHLLNHVKTVLSAAIRASVLGPYQAQGLLAGTWLKSEIRVLVEAEMAQPRNIEEAGQLAPMLDIWGGRHEIVYSRIFNS